MKKLSKLVGGGLAALTMSGSVFAINVAGIDIPDLTQFTLGSSSGTAYFSTADTIGAASGDPTQNISHGSANTSSAYQILSNGTNIPISSNVINPATCTIPFDTSSGGCSFGTGNWLGAFGLVGTVSGGGSVNGHQLTYVVRNAELLGGFNQNITDGYRGVLSKNTIIDFYIDGSGFSAAMAAASLLNAGQQVGVNAPNATTLFNAAGTEAQEGKLWLSLQIRQAVGSTTNSAATVSVTDLDGTGAAPSFGSRGMYFDAIGGLAQDFISTALINVVGEPLNPADMQASNSGNFSSPIRRFPNITFSFDGNAIPEPGSLALLGLGLLGAAAFRRNRKAA